MGSMSVSTFVPSRKRRDWVNTRDSHFESGRLSEYIWFTA
jgi:hypothetical protein